LKTDFKPSWLAFPEQGLKNENFPLFSERSSRVWIRQVPH